MLVETTRVTEFEYYFACRLYIVLRATQKVNGKWQFWGCQKSVTPEAIDKNLTYVITSVR